MSTNSKELNIGPYHHNYCGRKYEHVPKKQPRSGIYSLDLEVFGRQECVSQITANSKSSFPCISFIILT